jgi:glycosyltransferase involved in cell wall biosynthesis
MNETTVSVVIPTYNGAAFVVRALESVYAQTVRPVEVIVMDDASTDDTVAVVRRIAATAPVATACHPLDRNSGGPARPLNAGILAARGTLIAVLEQDDAMRPTRLERQTECWRRDPALALVTCRCMYISPAERANRETESLAGTVELTPLGGRDWRISGRSAYAALTRGMFALTWSTLLFPRQTWARCGGVDERFATASDYAFLQKVASRDDIGLADDALVDWYIRPDSLSRVARVAQRAGEIAAVLERFDPARLDAAGRRAWRARLRREAAGAAYASREAGHYGDALDLYATSLLRGGPSLEALLGIAKLLPHRLLRGAARPAAA